MYITYYAITYFTVTYYNILQLLLAPYNYYDYDLTSLTSLLIVITSYP